MSAETAIAGMYVPTLLLIAILALALSGLTRRFLHAAGLLRRLALPAVVDLCLFVIISGLLVFVLDGKGGLR